jgi:outer membrane protein OmpA-like peptidoglycan-associated protein
MFEQSIRFLTGLFLVLAVAACATTPQLSRDEVLSQNPEIARLEKRLKEARDQGADYLAPDGFQAAANQFDQALEAAAAGRSDAANVSAKLGLNRLDKVNRDVAQSRKLLREVLEARDRALDAGSGDLYSTNTAELEDDLRKTTSLVERGRLEDVKQRRPRLLAGYEKLELKALKEGSVATAKATLDKARENDAHKYAPKTYRLAEEELDLALSVLDADRTRTEKANAHASRARWLAERSIGITELIKDFARRDYSQEDVVLWYQGQLSEISAPLGEELPFDNSNRDVVTSLQNSVKELIAQRDATSVARSQYEQELSMTAEQKQAIESVETMFAAFEANVYQQRENVLISAHGFRFPPGGSELQTDNFTLLNKIIKAVDTFPESNIRVSGHTDSTGSDAVNMRISEQRAGNVARFLSEVGGITPERITVYGYGESRPVASNETASGRAANRRVEILIENR